MDENELIAQLRAIFDRSPKSDLVVGNGDDAAVLAPRGRNLVVSADVAVEGVHFRSDWSDLFEVGRKITAANLADICAMGAWPEYLVATLVLPAHQLSGILDLARGIAAEADLVGAQVIGGDLSSGSELAISITALGYCDRPIERRGARPGEAIVVTTLPGASAAGLDLLKRGRMDGANELASRVIAQHKAPHLDYERYRSVARFLSAATDISDGLVIDAGHLASASGVRFALDSEALRKSELSALDSERYLDWVLGGGEDHVLLGSTAEPDASGMIVIGRVEAGSGVTLDGVELQGAGFTHKW